MVYIQYLIIFCFLSVIFRHYFHKKCTDNHFLISILTIISSHVFSVTVWFINQHALLKYLYCNRLIFGTEWPIAACFGWLFCTNIHSGVILCTEKLIGSKFSSNFPLLNFSSCPPSSDNNVPTACNTKPGPLHVWISSKFYCRILRLILISFFVAILSGCYQDRTINWLILM